MRYLLCFFSAFLFFACDPGQDTAEERMYCGILSYDTGNPVLDTGVILNNLNLPRFIRMIEKQDFTQDSTRAGIPKHITAFLDQLNRGPFVLAEPDEDWQIGCIVMESLPERKINYYLQSENLFILSYFTAGIGVDEHLLIIEHDGATILDLWSGFGKDTRTKKDLLKHLKTGKDLSSNYIYL